MTKRSVRSSEFKHDAVQLVKTSQNVLLLRRWTTAD